MIRTVILPSLLLLLTSTSLFAINTVGLYDVEELPPYEDRELYLHFYAVSHDFDAVAKNLSDQATYQCNSWDGTKQISLGEIGPGEEANHFYLWREGQAYHDYDAVNINCTKKLSETLAEKIVFDLKTRTPVKGYSLRMDDLSTVQWKNRSKVFTDESIKKVRCVVGPRHAETSAIPQLDLLTDGSYSEGILKNHPLSFFNHHTKDCEIIETDSVVLDRMQVRVRNGARQISMRISQTDLAEMLKQREQFNTVLSFAYKVYPVAEDQLMKEVEPITVLVKPDGSFSPWYDVPIKHDYKYTLDAYNTNPYEVAESNMRMEMRKGEIYWSFSRPAELAGYNLVHCQYGALSFGVDSPFRPLGEVFIPFNGYSVWIKKPEGVGKHATIQNCKPF